MSAEVGAAAAPRKATSTYELVERMRAVLAYVDERDGEVDDAAAAEFDALAASLPERAEAIAAVYRELNEAAEACDRLARPYTDRAKQKRAQAEALKARLHAAMVECGETKIVTPTATIAIQKSSPKLELLVPEHEASSKVPAEYLETVTSIRKDAIKNDLLRGEFLTFARLVQGTHLRFR